MDDLKPCPFCGGEATVDAVCDYPLAGYFVGCKNCGAITDSFYPMKKAIEAWNRRATEDVSQ